MTIPDDLPGIIYYRMKYCVLTALPREPVKSVSTSGTTDAATVRPTIPYGAEAWRAGDGPWLPLDAIPAHWLPFLQRRRGTVHDFRPPPK